MLHIKTRHALRSCQLRLGKPAGASFPAERYKSSLDLSKLEPSAKFVVFLKKSDENFVLVADDAIEAVEKVRP